MKTVLAFIVGLVIFLGLIFGLNYFGYMQTAFFSPRVEQVRYNTFKQSQSYNDGMVRDLENLQMEYIKADAGQKLALRAIILHRFSVYDENALPPNLYQFYENLKRN